MIPEFTRQGLRFDLIVHSPYRALEGFFEDIKACRERSQGTGAGPAGSEPPTSSSSPEIDEALLTASDESLDRWKAASASAVDALMVSDAPLQVCVWGGRNAAGEWGERGGATLLQVRVGKRWRAGGGGGSGGVHWRVASGGQRGRGAHGCIGTAPYFSHPLDPLLLQHIPSHS